MKISLYCSACGERRDSLSSGGRGQCCKSEQLPSNARVFCSFCGQQTDRVSRSGRGSCCANVHTNRGTRHSSAIVDSFTPWKQDYAARAWVVHHPGGATLDEVGLAVGLTRERVRQIEAIAKKKIKRACQREGLEPQDVLRHLAQRHEEYAETVVAPPLATGPSEGLRAIKEALAADGDEYDGRSQRLVEEFYDERNARAVSMFDELDLEERAAFLFRVVKRASKVEGP